jgi:hypothetical protein
MLHRSPTSGATRMFLPPKSPMHETFHWPERWKTLGVPGQEAPDLISQSFAESRARTSGEQPLPTNEEKRFYGQERGVPLGVEKDACPTGDAGDAREKPP